MLAREVLDVVPQLAGIALLQPMGKAVDFVGGPSHRCRATRKARFLKLLRPAGGRADHSRDEAGHRIALMPRKAMPRAPGLCGNFPAFGLPSPAELLQDQNGKRTSGAEGGSS